MEKRELEMYKLEVAKKVSLENTSIKLKIRRQKISIKTQSRSGITWSQFCWCNRGLEMIFRK